MTNAVLIKSPGGANRASETASHYTGLQPASVADLAWLYSFDSYIDVARFLMSYPELIQEMVEAIPHISSIFKVSEALGLSVQADPDSEQIAKHLLVRIYTSCTPDEALNQLNRFDNEWLITRPVEFRNRVIFHVEYE